MKEMKKIANIIIAVLMSGLALPVAAQKDSPSWDFSARVGYNFGGTAPLEIPEEIESLDRYKAGAHFGVRLTAERRFNYRWGLMLTAGFEEKGMEGYVTVENFYTKMERKSSETDGDGNVVTQSDVVTGFYTGREYTKESTTQIIVPLTVRFHFNDRFAIGVGPQMHINVKKTFKGEAGNGYMRTGEIDPIRSDMKRFEAMKGEIDMANPDRKRLEKNGIYLVPTGDRVDLTADSPAEFDFSDDMRKFNCGAEVNFDFKPMDHLLVFANVDASVGGIMHSDFSTLPFELHPIFVTVGFGYSF